MGLTISWTLHTRIVPSQQTSNEPIKQTEKSTGSALCHMSQQIKQNITVVTNTSWIIEILYSTSLILIENLKIRKVYCNIAYCISASDNASKCILRLMQYATVHNTVVWIPLGCWTL